MLVAAGGHLWSVSTRGCWFCWNKIIREETAALIVGAEQRSVEQNMIFYIVAGPGHVTAQIIRLIFYT